MKIHHIMCECERNWEQGGLDKLIIDKRENSNVLQKIVCLSWDFNLEKNLTLVQPEHTKERWITWRISDKEPFPREADVRVKSKTSSINRYANPCRKMGERKSPQRSNISSALVQRHLTEWGGELCQVIKNKMLHLEMILKLLKNIS